MGSLPLRLTRSCQVFDCSGVSHKLNWGLLSQSGHDKDTAACRGDSEMRSIKHPPISHIPAFGKGPDNCLKVFAIVGIEQPRDVFKHQPAGFKGVDDVECVEEQAGTRSGKAAPFSCGTDVLAGEAADDDVGAP